MAGELDPTLLQAIQDAVAAGMAAQALPAAEAPPGPALQMTTTPLLGLKQPALDDPALIQDINDNMAVLDNSITATQAVTLTNKTLTAPVINNPTITGWTNAQHTHIGAAGGGSLDGSAIASGTLGTGFLLRETGASFTDPLVRDTVQFGAKPSGLSDTTLQRVLAGRLRLTGTGTDQAAMFEARAKGGGTLATTMARLGQPTPDLVALTLNARYDEAAAAWRPDDAAKAARTFNIGGSSLAWYDAVGADPLVWRQRMALDANGTLAVTPLVGVPGLTVEALGATISVGPSAPPRIHDARRGVFVGDRGLVMGGSAYNALELKVNSYPDTSNANRAIGGPEGSGILNLTNDTLTYSVAAGVAAGAVQTFAARLSVASDGTLVVSGPGASYTFLSRDSGAAGFMWYAQAGVAYLYDRVKPANRITVAATGGVNISPDAGSQGLSVNWPGIGFSIQPGTLANDSRVYSAYGLELVANGGTLRLQSSTSIHIAQPVGSYVHPAVDNQTYLGHPSFRFSTIYVLTAPVVGSSAELKEDIAPLDPAACVASVLDTDWVAYTYKAPAFVAPEPSAEAVYDEHDSNAQKAEKKAKRDAQEDEARKTHAKMVVETAPHRRQKGYVLNSPDYQVGAEFGLPDGTSRSDGADIAVVACALQQALQRIAVLEEKLAASA